MGTTMSELVEGGSDLSPREDIEAAIANRPENWREGQAAFNRLYELVPGWADRVRGTPVDPFHIDERIPEFLDFVDSITA